MLGLTQIAMPVWNRVQLKWFIARRALGFSADFTETLYQIYLNHSKIIHFRDGYPVYSLSTPALYSKPAGHFLAKTLYRSIQNKNVPNLMSFAVTDVCNVTCEHCLFYEGVEDPSREMLTLGECKRVLTEAQELGVSIINFVGGEPLMRPDLAEIIRGIDKDLSTVILFTNGWFLEEQARELRQVGVDGVYVSIDSSDPDEHDRLRKRKGLFKKAMEGIEAARRSGMTLGVSCCMTPEKFADGEFERFVEWGKRDRHSRGACF